ncbi:MAG: phosphoadenosine phosphosulfate reductase family protein [Thermosphaera sp.]
MLLAAGSFRVFDEVLRRSRRVFVAYSGGKDSTTVSLLLYDWLRERMGVADANIMLVNSDTLSEIPPMREWTRRFMENYVERLRALGVNAGFKIVAPPPEDTFYWRLFIRGYPAPSFSFRWCVYLLKRKPALKIVEQDGSAVLLGHRDDESAARARRLGSGLCPLTAGRCSSYYLLNYGNAFKAFPIRDWSEQDVWNYLRNWNGDIDIKPLFKLYGEGAVKARYGCWHCTLVKHQLGNYLAGSDLMYFEAFRLMYRWISDMPSMRAAKTTGYSRLGFLTAPARSILLNALRAAEELSGTRLYGLDEAAVGGHTLRQLLFDLPADEADKAILERERRVKGDLKRIVPVGTLRDVRRYRGELDQAVKYFSERARHHQLVKNYIDEITTHLQE